MTEKEKKAEQLIEKMTADRGYMYPAWEFAARNDPDFLEAYNNLYRAALNDGEVLPAKTRELIALGILAFRRDLGGVESHIPRAIRLGATRQEILEAIETAIIPGGAPTFSAGLNAMMAAFNKLDEAE